MPFPFTPPTPLPPRATDKEILQHIVDQCTELRHLAKQPRFRTLNYLLDMVRIEAEKAAKEMPG